MNQKLSAEERKYLTAKHKKEKNAKVRDRIKAVLAYDDGYSYSEIARTLLLDDETIRRHINDYDSKKKLKLDNKGGQSNLDNQQSEKLIAHLEQKTYLFAKDICRYVEKEFNVKYSISGMIKWLHGHNFKYKKPHGVPAKADPEKQAAFIEKYTELKNTIKSDEIILFGDSTHPQHQTKLMHGWIKKGVRKAEKMTACQKRLNLIGAINLATHQVEYQQVEWVNTGSLKGFVEHISNRYPEARKIHFILDNAGYHKSAEFLEYIKTTNIEIHHIPAYSPNLNPIERLWKIMHQEITYNRYYEKFADFRNAVLGFFENIGDYAEIIRNRINDNFQILKMS